MMKRQQSLYVASLLLSQLAACSGSIFSIRGALPSFKSTVEEYFSNALAEGEEESTTLSQNETHRALQTGPTNLAVSASFMAQVNKTYVFPQALNPDCAAGNEMVIGVTQMNIEGINRVTQQPIFSNSLRWMWRTMNDIPSMLPRNVMMASPRVVHDNTDNKFVVAATMTNKESFSKIYLAISKSSSPQTGLELDWDLMSVDVMDLVNNQQVWANELSLAVSNDAIYLTATMYTTNLQDNTDSFVESRTWIINKANINPSVAIQSSVTGTLNGYSNIFANVMAMDLDGVKLGPYVPAVTADGAYLVAYNDQSVSDVDELHVVEISSPVSGMTLASSKVALGNVDIEGVGPLPGATQPDPEYASIETGNRRVNDAVFFGNILHVATTVEDVQGETSVFWAKIDTTSLTTSDSGLMNGESIATGTSTFFPSIAVSNNGDMVVGYGAAGLSVYSGMYVSAASSSVAQPHVEVHAGEENYESLDGVTYHGQYSGLSADPVDTNCFWALNTFARMSDPFLWHTWERGALGVQWGKVCLS